MEKNLRKVLNVFLFAATASITNVYAEADCPQKEGKTSHPVPPAQYPSEEGTKNFSIGAAYTYWVPYQEGLNIAIGGDNSTTSGDIITPSVSAQSGFKVFASSNCYHDGWVAHLSYTWFYNPTSMQPNTLKNNIIYVPTYNANTIDYSQIESRFTNQFNRIDGTVDRAFFAGHYLAIRPWMGLLAAFDQQTLQYTGTISGGDGAYDNIDMHQRWWGIGPYGGTEATFYFAADWGLRVRSGLSMLLAEHNVTNNNATIASNFENTAINDSLLHAWNVEPMFEAALSLCWEGNWTNWGLTLDIGWELQTYFNHNAFLGYYSATGIFGNYSMQGLTVSARISF